MKHFYQEIPGWFDFQGIYSKMVEEHGDGANFVEVGTYLGKSISYLAVEIINSGKKIKLNAVDTWEGSPLEPLQQSQSDVINKTLYVNFLKNIEPVKEIINVVKSDSVKAADLYEDESVDFVFIDASHHYEFVKSDILAWYPKIKKNGYIGGHDYVSPIGHSGGIYGVYHAVNELFQKFEIVDNASWISKKE
jgi:hypothetical protein